MKLKALLLSFLTASFLVNAEVKPALYKYISADCNTLVGIDMKAIMSIPALGLLLKTSDSDELKQMNEMGLKPEDVEFVIIGLNTELLTGDPAAFEKQPELISISHVKAGITMEKLIAAAKSSEKMKITEETVDGVKAVIMAKDGKEFVMAQLSESVIAVGSMKMVKKSISLKGSAESGSISQNADLSKLANEQKNMFWVVGAAPKPKPNTNAEAPLDNPMAGVFGDIKLFTLDLDYTEKAVTLNTNFICNNPAGADKLAMTGQLMTGLLAASEDSPVKPEQIKFSKNESTVNIKISLDPATLIKTISAAKGLAE